MTNLVPHSGEGVRVIFGDSRNMKEVKDNSVGLVLTSPPYYESLADRNKSGEMVGLMQTSVNDKKNDKSHIFQLQGVSIFKLVRG